MTPEPLTLPGWSGANQIPDHGQRQLGHGEVPARGCQHAPAARVSRHRRLGRLQPTRVEWRRLPARLDKAPKNNVVIAVITATYYLYTGDAIRKKKYDYTLQLGAGATATASTTSKYF